MNKNQCKNCIYFNRLHQCCGIRLEAESDLTSYLHREPISEACRDFNIPDLPEFIQTHRTQKELFMSNDDRDWRALPVVHIYLEQGRLRIVGTTDGLGDLLYAIAMAMGKGTGTAELIQSNASVFSVHVECMNLESEWIKTVE